ncbi:MAG: AmmeMemoRadiSam system radical SAM enzyme [Peptococcaceae bacterium]|jgi:pyruvate formate lyase activating enzyme|nr:AmmeMemoRadiSam system radical SAM enzyme [Peptococcaceae bacterium]
MTPAKYQVAQENGVRCTLCPHHCLLEEKEWGLCNARQAENGTLWARTYGVLTAIHVDPIEKKPLRLFLPGTKTLSLGSSGCNLFCPFCQNMSISRARPFTHMYIESQKIVEEAQRSGIPSISYTYNEPVTFYEFMLDTARLAKEHGIFNVLVSNGHLSPEPLEALLPWIDALNIDIKTFDANKFKTFCGGALDAVLHTAERAAALSHLEVTTLMVPGLCDVDDVVQTADWLSKIRSDIPLHITRYFPVKKGQAPPTPIKQMQAALDQSKRHLKYVFLGNVN